MNSRSRASAFHCVIIIIGTLCLQAMADAADTFAKGVVQGPFVILPQDIRTGPESSFTQFVTDVNGVVFFSAITVNSSSGFFEQRLWMSNGTPDGVVVLDTNPNTLVTAVSPTELLNLDGTLFFVADGQDTVSDPQRFFGRELWRSDGSLTGTFMVADIGVGSGSSNPANLVNLNGKLLFSATSGKNTLGNISGRELWVSDGIPGGTTVKVKEINPTGSPGAAGHGIGKIATPIAVGNWVYFWADDGTHGYELWKTDGVPGGETRMVVDLNTAPGVSSTAFDPNPAVMIGSRSNLAFKPIAINGILYFTADDGAKGVELWRSNGFVTGTRTVADINATPGAGSDPMWLTEMNGMVFFTASDGSTTGRELWKYDPQADVAQIVKDIRPQSLSSRDKFGDDKLVAINGWLFFAADDGTNGRALWRTDGSSDGTMIVADISPATDGFSAINKLTAVGDILYFAADDGVDGVELWETDGTPGNAFKGDINLGLDGSIVLITGPRPIDFVASGGKLFLPADDGTHGDELWNTSNTVPAGFDMSRTRLMTYSQVRPPGNADLSITITDFFDPAFSEEQLFYYYDIHNNGPDLAVGVRLFEGFDASVTLLGSSGFCLPIGVFVCLVGNIPVGATVSYVTVVGLPQVASTTIIEARGAVGSETPDPIPGNNEWIEPTTILPPLPPASGADLAIGKLDLLDPVLPGTEINYVIQVLNKGPSLATNVVVTDSLPVNVSFKSAGSTPVGTCSETAGTVSCDIGPLAIGASVRIELAVIAPVTPVTVTNAANVTGSSFDPDLSNNSTTEDTLVGAPRDMAINEVFYQGSQATDWVELKNTGPSTVDLNGWQLCSGPSCLALVNLVLLDGSDLIVQSAEIIRIATDLDLATASELALFETAFTDSAAALVDFMQWGGTSDGGHADLAVAKGIWQQTGPGEFDTIPVAAAAESTAWCGANGGGGLLTLSSDFTNSSPTPGQENGVLCPGDLVFANGFE